MAATTYSSVIGNGKGEGGHRDQREIENDTVVLDGTIQQRFERSDFNFSTSKLETTLRRYKSKEYFSSTEYVMPWKTSFEVVHFPSSLHRLADRAGRARLNR